MVDLAIDSELCSRCKGNGFCGKPCRILNEIKQSMPKIEKHFSGSTPPEIFVGRHNYPEVNTGILSPNVFGNTERYSMPEMWYSTKAGIEDIMSYRGRMIYARFRSNVKRQNSLLSVMKEVAMASRAVSSEFFLKKKPRIILNINKEMPLIGAPAPLQKVRLEENVRVEKKVDYIVGDDDATATTALNELYAGNVAVSNIVKLLSAGLLGRRTRRKLVPTRWAITAADDALSKEMMKRIRYFQQIQDIRLFYSDYIGNHYEFLLLPSNFMFEVIEAKIPGSVWNKGQEIYFAQDYEGFMGRKEYADDVTGAYYSNRLALCEYFERTKRQGACFVMRECRPEYYAPCGVGVLREASRAAFSSKAEIFGSINEALAAAQSRMRLDVREFVGRSWLLREHGRQRRLSEYLAA